MKYILTIAICCLIYSAKGQTTHRKHIEGMTFDTYPPWYSCAICHKEFSPYQVLPKTYLDMRIPVTMGKDTFYWNGYGRFCDSLKRIHENEDSLFFVLWNRVDTSCISYEIAVNKSEGIWDRWLTSHKKGIYCVDTASCMSTEGIMWYYKSKKLQDHKDFQMGCGGRYSDSILLADKWYKIKLFKK